MKQTLIPTIAGDVLVVEVPKDANDFYLDGYFTGYTKSLMSKSHGRMYAINEGFRKIEILGEITADTCTVDCPSLVYKLKPLNAIPDIKDYRRIAEEIFRSLLEATGVVFENKVPKPETEYDLEGHPHYPLQQYLDEWQAEQQRVRGKAVIILINHKPRNDEGVANRWGPYGRPLPGDNVPAGGGGRRRTGCC